MAARDYLPDAQRWQAYAGSVVWRPDSGDVLVGVSAVARLPVVAPLYVITAHNPAGTPVPDAHNRAADERLRRRLAQSGLVHFLAAGGAPDGSWTEPGYAVAGLNREAAVAIALEFHQEAIFELTDDHSIVIATADATERSRRPRRPAGQGAVADMDSSRPENSGPAPEPSVFTLIPEHLWLSSNEHAFAVRDIRPVSPGHTLVISRRQVPDWWSASEVQRHAIWALVDVVKADLDEEFAPDGYNVGFNAGIAAGQTVPHLHIHLVPRYLGDVPDPAAVVRRIVDPEG
jgi:diadenosine tetraphosphate (Ap4A) HIT family hydrolase